jgi:predicted N-acyltransferase
VDYHTRVLGSLSDVPAAAWDELAAACAAPPFMRHAYLLALEQCGCVGARTGWQPRHLVLERGGAPVAACPLYLKSHSYGEYVFDWAWADAHHRHGVAYYPKLLCAIPFTPVPAAKLLARDDAARAALLQALLTHAAQSELSSLHLLFLSEADEQAAREARLLLRHTVQFHWRNREREPYRDFDDFLAAMNADKRKKIRQEERHVRDAGVRFEHRVGREITADDWRFFYRCYERTYLEHGNPPYLNEAFFRRMGEAMPENWLLITAHAGAERIASSLIAIDPPGRRAWGRYWGMAPAAAHVPQLHFAACYYQPLRWCIDNGYAAFEGGAQGEHKMARGLLPVQATSAHWLAHPAFADAVQRYLVREGEGIDAYLRELAERSPMRKPPPCRDGCG